MEQKAYILCIDVAEEDCEFLTESIHQFDPNIQLEFVSSGDKAIEHVRGEKEKLPSMIILDINIPGMDGKKTFLELRKILGHNVYPAIFLTTAPRNVEIEFAEEHGVIIMEKPNTMSGYQAMAESILEILGKNSSL